MTLSCSSINAVSVCPDAPKKEMIVDIWYRRHSLFHDSRDWLRCTLWYTAKAGTAL